jgi:multiple sugar transport system ATP-binding protein
MIAGLETVTEGTIRIGERVVNDVHPKDRDVAMVFQDYALYPHMTVRKNLSFALRMRKVPKAEIGQRVHETSELLGIGELLDRKPRALSGGQRQRVAVGRCIVRNPKVYLFDEPLSNLDAKLRTQMRAELKALHQRLGTTTVYVTHDQEEAMTLGNRLVVMAEGRAQQIGPPLDVYRRPENRFVAGFVGSPSMNFLEGTLAVEPGAAVFTSGEIRVPCPRPADVNGAHEVVLGVRPEHLRAAVAGAPGAIETTVEVTEPLGDRMDVTVRTATGIRLVARVPATSPVEPGETIALAADPSDLHLFQPGPYGRRLDGG